MCKSACLHVENDKHMLISYFGCHISPTRTALHKLLIYGERSGSFTQKANKDLAQATALLSWFKIYRPWEVEEAWQDMVSRGKSWVSRVEHGMQALEQSAPELGVMDWLKSP